MALRLSLVVLGLGVVHCLADWATLLGLAFSLLLLDFVIGCGSGFGRCLVQLREGRCSSENTDGSCEQIFLHGWFPCFRDVENPSASIPSIFTPSCRRESIHDVSDFPNCRGAAASGHRSQVFTSNRAAFGGSPRGWRGGDWSCGNGPLARRESHRQTSLR